MNKVVYRENLQIERKPSVKERERCNEALYSKSQDNVTEVVNTDLKTGNDGIQLPFSTHV
jgi:hypothetical protein